MSVNLLFKSLKDIRTSWLAYAAGLILYAYFITATYPVLFRDSTEFLRLLENYPESILDIFGGGTANLATVEGFLALEMFALMWFIIAGAFVIAYATGVIAKEIESGTIEMLLSQPITRVSALVTKSIVLFAGTIGLIIVTLLTTYITALAVDIELKPEGVIALGVIGGLFFLAIGSYSLLFSVIFGERGRAAFASAGLLTAMYLLTVLTQFADWAERLSALSLFHYYDSGELLSTGDIPLDSLAVFGGVIILTYTASVIIFNRRDIAP